MMTLMESEKLVKIVADTRTADGTKAVYGGPYPGGVIYATPAYIEKNPQTVQKVVNAFVQRPEMDRQPFRRGHRQADAGGICARQSADLCQGAVGLEADVFARRPFRARRGRAPPMRCSSVFDPAVASATFDLSKTYNDTFVKKAISGR